MLRSAQPGPGRSWPTQQRPLCPGAAWGLRTVSVGSVSEAPARLQGPKDGRSPSSSFLFVFNLRGGERQTPTQAHRSRTHRLTPLMPAMTLPRRQGSKELGIPSKGVEFRPRWVAGAQRPQAVTDCRVCAGGEPDPELPPELLERGRLQPHRAASPRGAGGSLPVLALCSGPEWGPTETPRLCSPGGSSCWTWTQTSVPSLSCWVTAT